MTDITKNSTIPAHLQDKTFTRETLRSSEDIVIVPRLKIVQKMSKDNIVANYGVGAVVMTPNYETIAVSGGEFLIVPIFCYREFFFLNPMGTIPAITDNTFDPKSEVAKLSRSSQKRVPFLDTNGSQLLDKDKKPVFKRAIEAICNVCILRDHEINTPFIASFISAEFGTGRRWATQMETKAVPTFGVSYVARSVLRPGTGLGTWWGLDIVTNSKDQYVDVESYNNYKIIYEKFKALYEQRAFRSAGDVDDVEHSNTDNLDNARTV